MKLIKIFLFTACVLMVSIPTVAKEILVMKEQTGLAKYDPSTGALIGKVNCTTGYMAPGDQGTLYTVVGYELRKISLDDGQILCSYALPTGYGTEISGLALGPDGCAYATQRYNNTIIQIDLSTGLVSELSLNTSIYEPTGLTFGADGDLYVCEGSWSSTDVVYRYNVATGDLVEKYTGTGDLVLPRQLTTDPSGDIYALNQCAFGLYKLDKSTNQFYEAIARPVNDYGFDSVAFTANGDVFLNHSSDMLARYNWDTGEFTDLASYTGRFVIANTVPEPGTCITLLCALAGASLALRRRH